MKILSRIKGYGIILCLVKAINKFCKNGAVFHFSEQGEDFLLSQYLRKRTGFYVDIGAFNPDIISITKLFYIRGWRGINIDANPIAIQRFQRKRKRDINVNMGVSDNEAELDYYSFEKHPGSNTFDKTHCEKHLQAHGDSCKIIKIKCATINDILARHLPSGQHIDFINLDVENMEMRILKTFDFSKYAPDYFIVEDLSYADAEKDFMDFKNSELCDFMTANGYIVVAKTFYTILFRKRHM